MPRGPAQWDEKGGSISPWENEVGTSNGLHKMARDHSDQNQAAVLRLSPPAKVWPEAGDCPRALLFSAQAPAHLAGSFGPVAQPDRATVS